MEEDIDHVLITEEQLGRKVRELGTQLAADYAGKLPILIGALNGATLFMSDLIRACRIPLSIDFIAVSSYGAGIRSSGVVRILKDLDRTIEDRHVVIVEDIVDTGLTLSYLIESLSARQPAHQGAGVRFALLPRQSSTTHCAAGGARLRSPRSGWSTPPRNAARTTIPRTARSHR